MSDLTKLMAITDRDAQTKPKEKIMTTPTIKAVLESVVGGALSRSEVHVWGVRVPNDRNVRRAFCAQNKKSKLISWREA